MSSLSSFNRSNDSLFSQYRENTHFGVGGRKETLQGSSSLLKRIVANSFTKDFLDVAISHFGTQGDGNHFGLVGNATSLYHKTHPALVTHHGSRGFGAAVFKRGMEVAIEHKNKMGYDVRDENTWIPKELEYEYWDALQIIRDWTYRSHRVIHLLAHDYKMDSTIFTPHNFVFHKPSSNLYYHAKGATPMWGDEPKLIPMNMRDGVLCVQKSYYSYPTEASMGFAPHGAGRNLSRMAFRRSGAEVDTGSTKAFFYSGYPDVSEMPQAYKSAKKIKEEIKKFNLGNVYDTIKPTHSLMAGLQPWRSNALKERTARLTQFTTSKLTDPVDMLRVGDFFALDSSSSKVYTVLSVTKSYYTDELLISVLNVRDRTRVRMTFKRGTPISRRFKEKPKFTETFAYYLKNGETFGFYENPQNVYILGDISVTSGKMVGWYRKVGSTRKYTMSWDMKKILYIPQTKPVKPTATLKEEPKGDFHMNDTQLNNLITMAQADRGMFKRVTVKFDGGSNTYNYKLPTTLVGSVKAGDQVVVEASETRSDTCSVATVVKVHDDTAFDYSLNVKWKWVISKVARNAFDTMKLAEMDATERLRLKGSREALEKALGVSISDIEL